jgi:hypothetical protein
VTTVESPESAALSLGAPSSVTLLRGSDNFPGQATGSSSERVWAESWRVLEMILRRDTRGLFASQF